MKKLYAIILFSFVSVLVNSQSIYTCNSSNVNIRALNCTSSTSFGVVNSGHSFVVLNPTTISCGYIWYLIDIPSGHLKTGYPTTAYVAKDFFNISGSPTNYLIVQNAPSGLFVKNTWGGVNTWIHNTGYNYEYASFENGQKLARTSSLPIYSGNDTWYQVYLTPNCYNASGSTTQVLTGWVSNGISSGGPYVIQYNCPFPAQVNSLTASPNSPTQINLSWSASSGATSYDIYKGTSGCVGTFYSNVSSTSNIPVTSLSPSTTYYFNVTAKNSCGTSAYSNCSNATTQSNCTASNPPNPISNSPQCGSITITRSGTVPSNETWYWQGTSCGTNTGLGTGSTFTANSTGTYKIKAYNNIGNCWSTGCGSVYVTVNSAPNFSYSKADVSCGGCNNGNITISPYSGTSPYQYSKDGGSTWQSSSYFSGLSAGSFTIVMKDASGCPNSVQYVTIYQPPVVLSINASANNISAGASVTFSSSVSNNPTSWNWNFNGGTPYAITSSTYQNPSITFNKPGCYKVTLQASNISGTSNLYSTSTSCYITVSPNSSNQCLPTSNYVIQQNYPSQQQADPINLATGSYQYKHTDFNIPAVSTSLNFTRYYNTVNTSTNNSLGNGWSHSYDFSVINQADTLWNVHYGDGHTSSFIPIYNGGGTSFPLYGGTFETLVHNNNGTWTLTFKNQEIFLFDATSSGKITSITDRNNNVTSLAYSGGKMISVTSPGGRALAFSYDGNNRIVSVSDPLGRNIYYSYNAQGNLATVTDANGGVTAFTYDNAHQINQITDARGNTLLTNVYDNAHHVTSQTDAYSNLTTIAYNTAPPGNTTVTLPGGVTHSYIHDASFRIVSETDEMGYSKSYAYNTDNELTSITDENGNTTAYTYDTKGNRTGIVRPLSSTTQITYNTKNEPLTILNALNKTTALSYNPSGNLTSVLNALNYTTTVGLDNVGQITSITDALNNPPTALIRNSFGDIVNATNPAGTSIFTYDSAGRTISAKDVNNHTTTFTYDNNDNIKIITDALGQTIKYFYDGNNNLIQVQDKKALSTYLTYDNKDRLVSIKDPMNGTTTFAYDVRDNLTKITDAIGNFVSCTYYGNNKKKTFTNAFGTTQYTYDGVGNLLSEVDANSYTTTYTYDLLNRIKTIADHLGNTSHCTYDALGQLVSVADALNNTTYYYYDDIGQLTKVQDAATKNSFLTYDANGKRLTMKDPNGRTTTFTYDTSNRLVTTTDVSGNATINTYDAKGNLATKAEANGVNAIYTYDVIDRLIQASYSTGENNQYNYDPNDNLVNMKNGGGATAFVYDNSNHVTKMTDPFTNEVNYQYYTNGLKKSVTYPGAQTVTYLYNGANALTKVTDWMNHSTTYTYDPTGKLTGMVYPNGTKANYVFDNASRLTKIENLLANNNIINQSIFTLDAVGNRKQEQRQAPSAQITAQSLTYGYTPTDFETTSTGASYTNDLSGNRQTETGANAATFNWTANNLLASYTRGTQQPVSMQYDPLGNRNKRTQGANQKRYLLDLTQELSQVLQEQNANGIAVATYIYGLGLISRIDSTNNIRYYHYDAQGNTIALSDSTGQITNTYSYEPFGELLKHIGNSTQPFLFSGKYGIIAEGSNLYHVRARYYDSNNGRFIGKDPLLGFAGNPQTFNRFVYGLNNPVSIKDVTGLYGQKDNNGSNLENTNKYDKAIEIATFIKEGRYLGTGYVQDANQYYENLYINNYVNGKSTFWPGVGLGFTSLWTPETYLITVNAFKFRSNYSGSGLTKIIGKTGMFKIVDMRTQLGVTLKMLYGINDAYTVINKTYIAGEKYKDILEEW